MTNTQYLLDNNPPVIIDAAYYDKLYNIATGALERTPMVAERLLDEIARADIKQSNEIPTHIINLGSKVTYLDEATGKTHIIWLVWPYEADIETQRISVLTPIGTALIGLSQGASIYWKTNSGEVRRLTITHVQSTRIV